MVGLEGLPAIRSGYAKFQPAPPQAEVLLCAFQKAHRVRTCSQYEQLPHLLAYKTKNVSGRP
jgi:hypothetical protein